MNKHEVVTNLKREIWAVIDIGTVTARLLIARVKSSQENKLLLAGYAANSAESPAALEACSYQQGSSESQELDTSGALEAGGMCIEELFRAVEICNLGLGVATTKTFSAGALLRIEQTLQKFAGRIKDFGVRMPDRVIVFATSATRDAQNSYLLEEIILKLGMRLEIISGHDEASYSFRGACFSSAASNQLVLDVGGGSSEFAFGSEGQLKLSHSFDVGARRVTELFFKHDPVLPAELESARAWIEEQFASFFARLSSQGFSCEQLVAVAGSATSVAAMLQELSPYDPQKVHGYCIRKEDLDDLLAFVATLSCAKREELVGLQPQRAGVIVGGVLVLSCALAASGLQSMAVSESDIMQGILLSRVLCMHS